MCFRGVEGFAKGYWDAISVYAVNMGFLSRLYTNIRTYFNPSTQVQGKARISIGSTHWDVRECVVSLSSEYLRLEALFTYWLPVF